MGSQRKAKPFTAGGFFMIYERNNQGTGYVWYDGAGLPKPLEEKEEARVIEKLCMEQDEEAGKILIEHNLRLVVFLAAKFSCRKNNAEDLVSIGTIGLIKAVKTYDPGRNRKLSTYAARCIENEIRMYLRHYKNMAKEISMDEPVKYETEGAELSLSDTLGNGEPSVLEQMETEETHRCLQKAVDRLSPRERSVIRLRFGLNQREETSKTQQETAQLLGVSQSYLSRYERRILNRLREEMLRYA